MLMWDFYSKGENQKALYAQTFTFVIFGLIGLYTGLVHHNRNYMIPQLLFIWPILKWFFWWKFLDWKFVWVIGLIVIIFYYFVGFLTNLGAWIQVLGFVIFPVSLMFSNNKAKYFGSLIGIFCIFAGSLYFLIQWFLAWNVSGTDLSYTLLPASVFVFYLKNLKKYLG